jgi:hypothetical protein
VASRLTRRRGRALVQGYIAELQTLPVVEVRRRHPDGRSDVQVLVDAATGAEYQRMVTVEDLVAPVRGEAAELHVLRATVAVAPDFTIRLSNGLRWLVPVVRGATLGGPELR